MLELCLTLSSFANIRIVSAINEHNFQLGNHKNYEIRAFGKIFTQIAVNTSFFSETRKANAVFFESNVN